MTKSIKTYDKFEALDAIRERRAKPMARASRENDRLPTRTDSFTSDDEVINRTTRGVSIEDDSDSRS